LEDIYGFLLYKIIELAIDQPPSDEETKLEVYFVIASLGLIVFNAAFNIFVFHLHFPRRPLGRVRYITHTLFAILNALSLGYILYLVKAIWDQEMTSSAEDNWVVFYRTIFIITFVLGLFIVINQFLVKGFLQKKQKDSVEKLIKEIGNSE
jgi:hypothetical protein